MSSSRQHEAVPTSISSPISLLLATMGTPRCLLPIFAVLLFAALTSSSPSFISDSVFQSRGSTGRSLLQARQSCPVSFEFMNYTIITSQCKGPRYLPNLCCPAFKDFACPYAEELNDPNNDCASTMFSYINLYGKYPPGLFASECREGKEGLACPALAPDSADPSGAHTAQKLSTPLLLGIILLLLFQFF